MKAALITIIMLLAACTSPAPTHTCWDGSVVSDVLYCPPEPQAEEPHVSDAPQEVEEEMMNDELRLLLERHKTRVESYSYILQAPPRNLARDEYIVEGSRMRINLHEVVEVNESAGYDTILVEDGAIIGYCLDEGYRVCPLTQRISLSEEVLELTPIDWLDMIETAEKEGERMYQQWPSIIVLAELADGTQARMIISEYNGIPHRVDILNPDGTDAQRYQFNNLIVNQVDEGAFEI